MDAFDADVLVYAAVADHPLGHRVRALFLCTTERDALAGIGSVLLIPELLSKPMRDQADDELEALGALLARLDLRPTDAHTARLATALASSYRLRAADAIHLATAVNAGATRFLTNNSKDFPTSIGEIDVVYPADLPG